MRLTLLLLALAACANGTKGTLPSSTVDPPGDDDDDVTTSVTTDLTGDDDDDDTTTEVDADGDGWPESGDCDDDDPNTYPGAEEICDGIDNDCDGEIPESEYDNDEDGVIECEETCAPPPTGTVSLMPVCEYVPNTVGTPFTPTIEWALTHTITDPTTGAVWPAHSWAEFDGYGSVYQAPAVTHATDDNFDGRIDDLDVPDIAAVMAYYDLDHLDGVLRLISGQGQVYDSISWERVTNANGTDDYAPYRYAGVAMGDVDGDGRAEIVTTVVGSASELCWPATYEVNQNGANVSLELEAVYEGGSYACGGHAASLADIDGDGDVDIVYGRAVFNGDMTQKWYATGGRGWYGRQDYPAPEGYWNSGYHSFAYDMDGDGLEMEVVAGRTVYEHDGATYCELGRYDGTTWVPAIDGYPAVGDIIGFAGDGGGEPEILVTGNEKVSVYHGSTRYDPNGLDRCVLIDEIDNAPWSDPAMSALPYHNNCDTNSKSFGGPPTIADFDGNGLNEFAVAGSCYYSVFKFGNNGIERYAMAETKDFSSASTGSTVFDFNGDGASEVVFSDEDAVYVWGLDDSPNLDPWERLFPYMVDDQHKSWTIHEYPLVADVDGDGKAEILVANSYLPGFEGHFGLYVLGANDDDWVSARSQWNQHAYFITNVEDDGYVSYGPPNYSPYTAEDFNSFRLQAPGAFGALAAPNAVPVTSSCQDGCGDAAFWIQVGNSGDFISVNPDVVVAIYGVTSGGQQDLLDYQRLNEYVDPGQVSNPVEFNITSAVWTQYDHMLAYVDDPAATLASADGHSKECDETDNTAIIPLTGFCP